MLEVRNLTKIYKSKKKNGTDTYALNDVSLKFPEKGMVFLLGKSGSGKSTLLNVCGGLDSPTSGEVIVKGRSSKSFVQSDFDSYRNTFVGFIFQEYNILNEFTVEDNIALALELQGKPKDKKAIAELLEQVDLTGFAKRKPNTLSGGQKQRIAIARALVKSPEIIMADEPTGALDSATGKQVFDTLKKLSEDKLVIIVSHDREFAELYADRIIELKDGKILSDVSKTQEVQQSLSGNLTAIGDILCIKQGTALTDSDFERIKSIIKGNSGDVIIASNEADVQNFKKVNRITDKDEKEVFKDTDESRTVMKSYTPEQSKFIRSKLPVRHAARIGVSGLRTKPIRLFFTVVLCVVSFVLFGILSTLMLYNHEDMFKETMKTSNQDFVVFDKIYSVQESYYENGQLTYSYDNEMQAKFSSADIEKIKGTFGDGAFGAVGIHAQLPVRQTPSSYWNNELTSVAYMGENAFARRGLIGEYPEKEDEIAISSYFAKMLVECKAVDDTGSAIDINSHTEIVGKTIAMDGMSYKVTGVFESGEIDPKFDVLKEGTSQDYALEAEFRSALEDGTHLLIAVSEDGLERFSSRYGNMFYSFGGGNRMGGYYVSDTNANESGDRYVSQTTYNGLSALNGTGFISIGEKKTSLADNDAVLQFNDVYDYILNRLNSAKNEASNKENEINNILSEIFNMDNEISYVPGEIERCDNELLSIEEQIIVNAHDPGQVDYLHMLKSEYEREKNEYENRLENALNSKAELISQLSDDHGLTLETAQDAIEEFQLIYAEVGEIEEILNIIRSGKKTTFEEGKDEPIVEIFTNAKRAEMLEDFIKKYPQYVSSIKLNFCVLADDYQTPLTEERSYNVVGIIAPTNSESEYVESKVYFNDNIANGFWETQKQVINYNEFETKYKDEEGAVYTKLYAPFDHSDAQVNYLWDVASTKDFAEDDSMIGLLGSYVQNLEMIDTFVSEFSKIFLYVGLVLAAFAILLFSNFISVSISQKRREIGILRAVGARSLDVFKIFFSESLVIAAICSVLSIIGSSLICGVLNTEMGAALGASIFVFGIASMLIILAIALLTAILATFLPVWNAAKKKPVESIRAI